jgi:hypothetical protein
MRAARLRPPRCSGVSLTFAAELEDDEVEDQMNPISAGIFWDFVDLFGRLCSCNDSHTREHDQQAFGSLRFCQ